MKKLEIYDKNNKLLFIATDENGFMDLTEQCLQSANLQGMTLQGFYFTDSDLRWASLDDADLYWADLTYCNMEETSCRFADFRGADLTGAVLRNSDLTGAKFGLDNIGGRTNLSGAD